MKIRVLAAGVGLLTTLALGAAIAADDKPYKVADGNKVDKVTLEGWRTWRALACERCHGAQQQGMVGPSLIDSMKRLSKDEFKQSILKGKPDKGMPNFDGSQMVTQNIDGLYAFLKGRSDGAIQPGRLEELK
jgi:mono/diheme cytochrome c family protein